MYEDRINRCDVFPASSQPAFYGIDTPVSKSPITAGDNSTHQHDPPEIIVAGALAVDYSCDFKPLPGMAQILAPVPHTSNPAVISQTFGGVGHNVAYAAQLLGRKVSFCSVVGDDLPGGKAIEHLRHKGTDVANIQQIISNEQRSMWQ